jgi:hypothetical protein
LIAFKDFEYRHDLKIYPLMEMFWPSMLKDESALQCLSRK